MTRIDAEQEGGCSRQIARQSVISAVEHAEREDQQCKAEVPAVPP